jgi:hypothetical protein
MSPRVKRLKKLFAVQEQLKALHETRHAGHLADILAAETEAAEIAQRFDDESSLSALFPEIYNRRVAGALARAETSRVLAERELRNIAAATARTNLVERSYRDALRQDERETGDRERLEAVTNAAARPGKLATSL